MTFQMKTATKKTVGTVDNLYWIQLNVTGTAKILIGPERIMIGDNNEEQVTRLPSKIQTKWCSMDESNVSQNYMEGDNESDRDVMSIQKHCKTYRHQGIVWKNICQQWYQNNFRWLRHQSLSRSLSEMNLSPNTLYELFFDDEVIEMICINTKWVPISHSSDCTTTPSRQRLRIAINPTTKAKCWSSSQKRTTEVPQPHLLAA
jgi:hypothetical protein